MFICSECKRLMHNEAIPHGKECKTCGPVPHGHDIVIHEGEYYLRDWETYTEKGE